MKTPDVHGESDRVIGGYRLIRPIAKGGMGEVYEGMQTRLDRRVAIKLLSPRLARDPVFVQRFEREARSAAAINHDNVVQVYDFYVEGQTACFVMEFVEGKDLADIVIERGPLPVDEALRIASDIAEGLREALKHGIIHRDIKPANILLTPKGQVKISDLGLARRMGDDMSLTATGIGIGTPHFISPEQADDAKHADHRSDIYSLGITLVFLLTGKRPFEGKSALSILRAHASEPLPTGTQLGIALPERVDMLLRHMTAKQPENRYQNYDSLISDIARVRSGRAPLGPHGGLATKTTVIPKPASGLKSSPIKPPTVNLSSKTRYWLVAVVTGLLTAGVTGGYLYTHRKQLEKEMAGQDGSKSLNAGDQAAIQDFMQRPADSAGTTKSWLIPGGVTPLAPIRPILNPLPLVRPGRMFAQAEAYAEKYPENYRDVLARFRQVKDNASGTRFEQLAEGALEEWTKKRDEKLDAVLPEFVARVKKAIAEHGHRQGISEWRFFPEELRDPQVDERLLKVIDAMPPPQTQQQ